MNISLRKANALQQSILDTIRGIDFGTTISINEFQDPETEINTAGTEVYKNLARITDLYSTLYMIRGRVGLANSESGISASLAAVAHLEKQIQVTSNLASSTKRVDLNIIKGKLDKIRNNNGDQPGLSVYSRQTEVITGIFTDEEIASFKANILKAKKLKQKYQDAILELNIKTEITLDDDVVAILQKEDLL